MSFMSAPDERTGETFSFEHMREPLEDGEVWLDPADGVTVRTRDKSWRWQRFLIEFMHLYLRVIQLKSRQLGCTWLVCAYHVWAALYLKGSTNLEYRQRESEAVENVMRCWALLHSLPPWMWNGAKVIKPTQGALPYGGEIHLQFPDGSVSRIVAMTSAKSSGHGRTVANAGIDEHSRVDNAGEIMKGVNSAVGSKGRVQIVSTANGVADLETGEGNYYHYMWSNAAELGYEPVFLPWSLHPERDEAWYETSPEIRSLRSHERAEQYPANPNEAFALTSRHFFDQDSLSWYAERLPVPLYRCEFQPTGPREAKLVQTDDGRLVVFREPAEGRSYAISADIATGRGVDYSSAHVIDLSNMEIAAEWHGRVGVDVFTQQLHYVGKWYNTALIAPEAGGFGEAVLVALRDGVTGRPPYPRIYRHVLSNRPDKPHARVYGFPMNAKTRPLVVNGLEAAIRERALPWLTPRLISECRTFVHRDSGPSPRAQDGSRDDTVMSAGIGTEMYRLYGHHPERKRPEGRKAQGYQRRIRTDTLKQMNSRYPA